MEMYSLFLKILTLSWIHVVQFSFYVQRSLLIFISNALLLLSKTHMEQAHQAVV